MSNIITQFNEKNNKIINSRCICKKGLAWLKGYEVIMVDPCEHLIHKKCFDKLKTSNCPICKNHVIKIIHANDFKYDKSLYQKCIDIISMSNFDKMTKIKYDQVLLNLPNLIGTITQFPFTKGTNESRKLCEDVFAMNNIEIKVKGLSKIKPGPKVFISNHTSHLDFIVIFYILKTGFLTSSAIKENPISKQLLKMVPLLVVERGKDTNTVQKMKEYVENIGPICLFPEGMLTHPDTIIRFRTGAFHIGHPIYPIVLKYKNALADMSTKDFILKIASHQKEIIEMHILDPFYPPFDENKIEMVRYAMANRGNMLLSRVSNRDVVDNN